MKIRMSMLNTRKPPVKTTVAREIAEWAITLGLAVGLALCVHTWVGQVITVDGPSMQPTLWKGDRMLVGRVEYYFTKPKRGDIVIVSFPDRTGDIVKRVIATAGEKVKVSGGSVYINGKKLDEPYILEPINQDFAETYQAARCSSWAITATTATTAGPSAPFPFPRYWAACTRSSGPRTNGRNCLAIQESLRIDTVPDFPDSAASIFIY
jgi:signal peptidase I